MKYGYFTKKTLLVCLLCILTISTGSCINIDGWSRVEYEKTNKLDAPLAPGSTLALENDVGSITTDMPLTIKGKVSKNLQGTIGAGEGKLYLRTDVGSIRIR